MSPLRKLDKLIPGSRRFGRWLAIGTLLVNLFLVGIVALVVVQDRRRAEEQAALQTRNYSQTLGEGLAGFIRVIDNTLLTVRDEIGRRRSGRGFDGTGFDAFLVRQNDLVPGSLGLRVVDARGITRHAVGDVKARGVDLSDRPYFLRQRDDPDAGLVISDPLMSRISGQWVVTLSRRLDNPDGSFAGEVHVAVATARLIQALSRLDLGPRGNSAIWSPTALIARYARDDRDGATTGSTTPSPELRRLLAAGEAEAGYHARSGIDSVPRVYRFRRVGAYRLFTVVGLADDDYLAEWRENAGRVAGLAGLFVAGTTAFAWLTHSAWRRREQAQAALRDSEERLGLAVRGADLAMIDWDIPSDRLMSGDGWHRLLGYAAGELPPQSAAVAQLIREEDRMRARRALIRHLKQETPLLEAEVRMRHRDGRWIWVLARGMAVARNPEGRALRLSGTVMDITGRKEAEMEVARLSQWNELLLNSAGEGIFGVDLRGRCTFVNPAAMAMLGYAREEIIGRDQQALLHEPGRDRAAGPEPDGPIAATLCDGVRRQAEDVFRRRNGEGLPVQITVTPMLEYGAPIGVVVVFRDIARRKAMEAELLRLATTDPLTGAANRRRFLEHVATELARVRRIGTPAALLMVDLDHFKAVNDTFGHAVGDAVLQHFVATCTLRMRRTDLVGRLGGEEFGIVLPGTDAAGALRFAESLRQNVAESPAQTAKGPVAVTVSIGVAAFAAADPAPDDVLTRADAALYRAKERGRNAVESAAATVTDGLD